jgi:hypothetical protein
VVLVIFDQLRGDYLPRWQTLFGKGGFRRLMEEGAWCENCHYPYAATLTAAGHASMATGATPASHGIIANEWYGRAERARVHAVRTERYRPVPDLPGAPKALLGAAPTLRRRPAVADELHKGYKGKAKVVSLSIKERSAMLLAALLRGELCFWFSPETGGFATSTYYANALPRWVEQFNRQRPADKWFGKQWTRLRPNLDYAAHSSPDDTAAEGIGYAQGRTFPHPLTGGKDQFGPDYYDAWANSPFGNEVLLDLAKVAIDAEKLGRDDVPDLLCLSFASNDMIGHAWGPDSQEVLDVTLRSDVLMRDLLDFLDNRVGKGRYLMVVCADHGVCPIPELAKAQGKDAARVAPEVVTTRANAYLNETFSKAGERLPWIEATSGPQIYLNRAVLKEKGLASAKVEEALARWLAKQPGVQTAYTRTRLSKGHLKDDALGEAVRLSFDVERSGDVIAVLRPYHLLSAPVSSKLDAYRTTHGTPHPYDTHVPLLVYGPGVMSGARKERVTPLAVAPILARGLGIAPPVTAEVPLPEGLFR